MIVKAQCIECWETLGDYDPLFKIPDDIQKRITDHSKRGHAIQVIQLR